MKLYQRIHIRKHERGLEWIDGEFAALLTPGVYRFISMPGREVRVEVIDITEPRFQHGKLDALLTESAVREALEVVELTDDQRALVWMDERLAFVAGPGTYAFWRDTPHRVRVEVFEIEDLRLQHKRAETIVGHPTASRYLTGVRVDSDEHALLFVDGELSEVLKPGLHLFWKGQAQVTWKAFDKRQHVADVAGQEIMTADKVTLRVNLVVAWQVVDPVAAVATVTDVDTALYREAQLVLREAIGTRKLDTLLSDKQTVGEELAEALRGRAEKFGVEVASVGLRDIILPGEMREILNQVIAAEKQAQAELIKRREEVASARSQANTAKLLADNPTLTRMKELESLAEILKGAKTTFVFGSGDLSTQVKSLLHDEAATSGEKQPP